MNVIAKPEVMIAATERGVIDEVHKWYQVARKAKWQSLMDVREGFPSADKVDDFLIFNIDHNRFRLITKVNFRRRALYFVGIFTHKEYDRNRWHK